MSFPLLDVVCRSGSHLAFSVSLTFGAMGCIEDNAIYDDWPTGCETDAECPSCRAPKIAVCH